MIYISLANDFFFSLEVQPVGWGDDEFVSDFTNRWYGHKTIFLSSDKSRPTAFLPHSFDAWIILWKFKHRHAKQTVSLIIRHLQWSCQPNQVQYNLLVSIIMSIYYYHCTLITIRITEKSIHTYIWHRKLWLFQLLVLLLNVLDERVPFNHFWTILVMVL